MEQLTYFVYPESIDIGLLNTTSLYSLQQFGHFTKELERSRTTILRGKDNEAAKCVVCKVRPATGVGAFQSVPITSHDEQTSHKLNYYRAMLELYA